MISICHCVRLWQFSIRRSGGWPTAGCTHAITLWLAWGVRLGARWGDVGRRVRQALPDQKQYLIGSRVRRVAWEAHAHVASRRELMAGARLQREQETVESKERTEDGNARQQSSKATAWGPHRKRPKEARQAATSPEARGHAGAWWTQAGRRTMSRAASGETTQMLSTRPRGGRAKPDLRLLTRFTLHLRPWSLLFLLTSVVFATKSTSLLPSLDTCNARTRVPFTRPSY